MEPYEQERLQRQIDEAMRQAKSDDWLKDLLANNDPNVPRNVSISAAPAPEPESITEPEVEEQTPATAEVEYASVAPSEPTPVAELQPRPRKGTGILREEKPWPDPVDGAELLDELAASVKRFMVLPPFAHVAIAGWVMHTYVVDAGPISPILAIESPTPECGKSTLQDWLAHVVDKPLLTSNTTPSAIFRLMDQEQPTLLMDEADTQLTHDAHELRGVLNSGHRKSTANVTRSIRKADDAWALKPCPPGELSRLRASERYRPRYRVVPSPFNCSESSQWSWWNASRRPILPVSRCCVES